MEERRDIQETIFNSVDGFRLLNTIHPEDYELNEEGFIKVNNCILDEEDGLRLDNPVMYLDWYGGPEVDDILCENYLDIYFSFRVIYHTPDKIEVKYPRYKYRLNKDVIKVLDVHECYRDFIEDFIAQVGDPCFFEGFAYANNKVDIFIGS
jgi:hypothetical protein